MEILSLDQIASVRIKDGGIQEENDMFVPTEDGAHSLSKLGIYTVISQSTKVFKRALISHDDEDKYTVLAKPKPIKDPRAIKEKEKEFAEAKKAMQKELEEYKTDNASKFFMKEGIPNVAVYCSKDLNLLFAEALKDPDTAHYLFRTFEANEKDFKETALKDIMVPKTKTILPEYKEEFDALKESLRKQYGVPTTAEISAMVKDEIEVQPRSLRRIKFDPASVSDSAKIQGSVSAELYMNMLIQNFARTIKSE